MSAFFITTARFLLRPLTPDDATARYSSWFEEPQASRYIIASRSPHDPAALRAYIEERAGRPDVVFLGIFAREGGAHVGNLKFEPVDESEGYAVMGVLIGDPAWRGRGATTEVLDASIAWLACRRGIREVVLGVERDHRAAIRAYEKAGFRIETTDRINVDPRSQLAMVRYI